MQKLAKKHDKSPIKGSFAAFSCPDKRNFSSLNSGIFLVRFFPSRVWLDFSAQMAPIFPSHGVAQGFEKNMKKNVSPLKYFFFSACKLFYHCNSSSFEFYVG